MLANKKLCVSVPLFDEELDKIESKIDSLQKQSISFFEFRFDFLKEYDNLDRILEVISKYRYQSIYTLRSPKEGGQFPKDESERLILLKKLALAEPMLLDLEYGAISKNDEFADFIDHNNVRTLMSWHDFTGTPDKEFMVDLIDNMRVFSNYVKIVTTAKSIDDSINILGLYNLIDSGINLVAFSMGELGIISRVLCSIVGNSPFTYATIENPVAPGQLTVNQMKSVYSLFHNKLI